MIGSPPHTWRIPNDGDPVHTDMRITSTYVENTSQTVAKRNKSQDHLHIRGEYRLRSYLIAQLQGSPPHTWRIPYPLRTESYKTGITSTYVENTINPAKPSADRQDHLHIRGEYLSLITRLLHKVGSPPHTWRIQSQVLQSYPVLRITSTYVENTIPEIQYRQRLYGSPPHTWRIQ